MKQYCLGFFTGACLFFSSILFIGAKAKSDILKVSEIQIIDNITGNIGVRLFSENGTGKMIINRTDDNNNLSKIALGCDSNGGSISIYNTKEKIIGGLFPDINDGGTIILNNEFGENRCYFGADEKNNGLIELFDSYGYFGRRLSGKN